MTEDEILTVYPEERLWDLASKLFLEALLTERYDGDLNEAAQMCTKAAHLFVVEYERELERIVNRETVASEGLKLYIFPKGKKDDDE